MTTIKIRISGAIMNELAVRCPDEDGAWKGIDNAGVHAVGLQQAKEIAGDCDYQGNITGNWIDPVSSGVTRAYRALYWQIQRALRDAIDPPIKAAVNKTAPEY